MTKQLQTSQMNFLLSVSEIKVTRKELSLENRLNSGANKMVAFLISRQVLLAAIMSILLL